jgi:hypothetical protein
VSIRAGGEFNNPDDGLDRRAVMLLRETMSDYATDVVMPVGFTSSARARARRIVVRRRVAALCAAVVSVTAVGAGAASLAAHHDRHSVVVASLLPDWPPRGTDTNEASGIDAAMLAWDAATGQHHSLQKVLYAGRDSVGSAVLLLATDGAGKLRLGGLVGSDSANWHPTTLALDQPVTTRLVAAAMVHNEVGRNPVLIVATDPRYTQMSWTNMPQIDTRPPNDSLVGGIDIVNFFDPAYVPSTVTFTGPGMPDLKVAVPKAASDQVRP